jgi:uncharacterized protein (TIGR03663 family)
MSRGRILALIFLAAVGLALRVPQLDQRPMHTDESVHAIKFLGLWEKGLYRYDPHEYHGPSLYYATLPLAAASGARSADQLSEATLRLVPVLFGIALILLPALAGDGLGRSAVFCAAALTAVSPVMGYYSRYYIHEMMLVVFTAVLGLSAWRYLRTGNWVWCVLAGASLGLMHATKETFVFNLAAMGAGGMAAWLSTRRRMPSPEPASAPDGGASMHTSRAGAWSPIAETSDHARPTKPGLSARIGAKMFGLGGAPRLASTPALRPGHCLLGLAVATVVSITLFTSFFSHPTGPLDSIRTYEPWVSRAGGQSPHIHSWDFYFGLLLFRQVGRGPLWTEGLVLALGLLGIASTFSRWRAPGAHPVFLRSVAVYTFVLTSIYTLIPYKTPWCVLGFWHGCILLAGAGAAALLAASPRWIWKLPVAAALAAGMGHLGLQSYRANFLYAADQRNPWVYAHTLPDIANLVERVQSAGQVHEDSDRMVIKIAARGGDYWPLPWYLRGFKRVGYWSEAPDDLAAPVVITSANLNSNATQALDRTHQFAGFYGLRPAVFLQLLMETNLWQKVLAAER